LFLIQKRKFFPLPDYELNNNKVSVSITGKVVDINYARKLASVSDLALEEIILLDKVAKKKPLLSSEIKHLKAKKLIEGRKPNFHISSNVANATNEKSEYIKLRGFKDDHYKKMILEYIAKYGSASKQDIDGLISDILPDVLDKSKKENKVRNIVYSMSKKDGSIKNEGTNRKSKWVKSLSKNE
jgi:ATP-dependent DNA helicase RecG